MEFGSVIQRALRSPHRAVGKTIAEVVIYGWRHELRFTDGTKLQVEPGEESSSIEPGMAPAPALIFQDDPEAD